MIGLLIVMIFERFHPIQTVVDGVGDTFNSHLILMIIEFIFYFKVFEFD